MALEAEEEKERLQLEVKSQQAQIEANAPRVLFSQAVETSGKSILIGELAKILRQNGIEIGERRLFEIKKTTINKPDGTTLVSTTKVSGKGQIYFVDKFLRQAA